MAVYMYDTDGKLLQKISLFFTENAELEQLSTPDSYMQAYSKTSVVQLAENCLHSVSTGYNFSSFKKILHLEN